MILLQFGFDGDERLPAALLWRFFLPVIDAESQGDIDSGRPLEVARDEQER